MSRMFFPIGFMTYAHPVRNNSSLSKVKHPDPSCLKNFPSDYLKQYSIQNPCVFDVKEILENCGINNVKELNQLLEKLFPPNQDFLYTLLEGLLDVSHKPEEEKFNFEFLYALCCLDHFPGSENEPISCNKEREKFKNYLEEVFPPFLYTKTALNFEQLQSKLIQREDNVKTVRAMCKGVVKLDKKHLVKVCKSGLGMSCLFNFIALNYYTFCNGVGPAILESTNNSTEANAVVIIANTLLDIGAGIGMGFWRKNARLVDELLNKQWQFEKRILGKLIELYQSRPEYGQIKPLPKGLYDLAGIKSPAFSEISGTSSSSTSSSSSSSTSSSSSFQTNSLPSSASLIHSLMSESSESIQINQEDSEIAEELEFKSESSEISKDEVDEYESNGRSSLSPENGVLQREKPSSSPIPFTSKLQRAEAKEKDKESETPAETLKPILPNFTRSPALSASLTAPSVPSFDLSDTLRSSSPQTDNSLQINSVNVTPNITPSQSPLGEMPLPQNSGQGIFYRCEVTGDIKNSLSKVKATKYSTKSIQKFVTEIKEQEANHKDKQKFFHGHIFKSTYSKIKFRKFWRVFTFWKKRSSRGNLFSHFFQLYKKNQVEELKDLIQKVLDNWEEKYPEKMGSISDLTHLIKDKIRNTNGKNRTEICEVVMDLVGSILKSDIASEEKTILLKAMLELVKGSQGLKEKRNIHRTEIPVLAVLFDIYNLPTYIGNGPTAELITTATPSVVTPLNSLFSEFDTTTLLSLVKTIEGAIAFNENQSCVQAAPSENSTAAYVKALQNIFNDPINQKTICGRDKSKIFTYLEHAQKEGKLSLLLEHKHGFKNYVLFELMNKMFQKDFNKVLQMLYPISKLNPRSLTESYSKETLLDQNSLATFHQFLQTRLSAIKNADKEKDKHELTLLCCEASAYLSHMYDYISQLDQNLVSTQMQKNIYMQCRQTYGRYLNQVISEKESVFRPLAQTRSKPVLFFWKVIGKVIGRLAGSRVYRYVLKPTCAIIGVGLAFSVSTNLVGILIVLLGYFIRVGISAIFDNPDLLHTKSTRSYQSVKKCFDHLGVFEDAKSNLFRYNDKKSVHALRAFFENKVALHHKDSWRVFLGDIKPEIAFLEQLNIEISNFPGNVGVDRAQLIFDKILSFSLLSKGNVNIGKNFLWRQYLTAMFLACNCDLDDADKLKMESLFQKELQNEKSLLGQFRRHNSFVREKRFFLYDIASCIYCLPSVLCKAFASPFIQPFSMAWDCVATVAAGFISYPLKDWISGLINYKEKKYSTTTRSAKLSVEILAAFERQFHAGPAKLVMAEAENSRVDFDEDVSLVDLDLNDIR